MGKLVQFGGIKRLSESAIRASWKWEGNPPPWAPLHLEERDIDVENETL